MRALIISLALLVSAVVCTGFLAIFAGFGAGAATLGSLGVGLFMVAALFAAIAALGPKLRPTPLLTPAMAGTSAAVITTMAILAGSSQIAQGKRAVLPTSEPAKVTDTASEAPSPPSPAPIEPQVASPPPPSPAMIEPQDANLPPEPSIEAATTGEAPVGPDNLALPPLQLQGAIAPAAIEGPDAAALPPGGDAQTPAGEDPPAQSAGPATTVAGTDASAPVRVPIPRRPPASPGLQGLSEDGFDTSSVARPATSPTTLTLSEDGFDASSATTVSSAPSTPAPTATVIPPLPRSRPCGEGGPACP